jgi:hypothetical protein
MAATAGPESDPPAWADRYKWIASRLADHLSATRPKPDGFVPGSSMPAGQDIPCPQGLYTAALIAPGEWPEVSESGLARYGQSVATWAREQDDANDDANMQVAAVLNGSWVSGDAWAAAHDHYAKERIAHDTVVDAGKAVAAGTDRLSEFTRFIKGEMRRAHDEAHRRIEMMLRSANGSPVGVGSIVSEYRPLIAGWSTELHQSGQAETTLLTNKFGVPEAPADSNPGDQEGAGNALPTDGPIHGDPQDPDPRKKAAGASGAHFGLPSDSPANGAPNTSVAAAGSSGASAENALPTLAVGAPTSSMGQPKMPSIPSPPSMGGGGGSPLSKLGGGGMGLQGLMGGGKGVTGPLNNISPAALPGGPAGGAMSPTSLGSQFGRGMAAGAGAAGAMPPMSRPPPQAPSGPLAAPISPAGGAPVAAAPAGEATFAPGGNAGVTGAPAVAGGGTPAGAMPPMSSYGSVLPPSGISAPAGGGGGAASIGGVPAAPPVNGGAGTPASTGFMPVRDQGAPQRISRDVSMTDLDLARLAVADLAAASAVVYPGLEWAVVVSRGSSSGLPDLWVTANEGAGYIPAGVYVRRSMPLAARFDEDFDTRWFGWFNPAETAVRAVRAHGGAVSAIATTWPRDSELISAATPDVAIAVAPSSAPGDAEAAQLLSSRSHRLETVAPGVYQSLHSAEQHIAKAYARQLTQEAAFSGPELSAMAQSVARALISSRWPSSEEWSALQSEYEIERLMAGSQRPGLQGIEEPEMLVGYMQDFVRCRRLETLLCWEDGTPADVVYAAAMAGVSLNPLPSGALF